MYSRSEQRQGWYIKEWSKLDLQKQLSNSPTPPPAGSRVTRGKAEGNGTWQALAENFGLRSPRFRAGPAWALVLCCLVNLKNTSQSISWLLGDSHKVFPEAPRSPGWADLGKQVQKGVVSEG